MEIRAFRGWRYKAGASDVSDYIAPPYDVLSSEDKRRLLTRKRENIVAVDLPHCPPWDAGPDHLYAAADQQLRRWTAQGVLIQEAAPALYAYQQSYSWSGRRYVRRAMICGVRATPLGQDVLPHEQTRPGPKADRLKLTQQTRMQLSPIFGFYNDPSDSATELLFSGATGPPAVQGELGGIEEKLWAVTDAEVIERIAEVLGDVPVFLADGHHRYMTALNYRDELLAAGVIDEDHEANFVMFALVARDDPGLLIIPTHRMIGGLAGDFSIAKLAEVAPQFAWSTHARHEIPGDLHDSDAWLGRFGSGAIGFVEAGSDDMWTARLTDQDAMRQAAPEQIDAWRGLDVAVLHTLIVEGAVSRWRTGEFTVKYTPHVSELIEALGSGEAQLGAILQGIDAAAIEAVARAGAVMPAKTTFFYPKLATGMVLKPLQ